MADSEHRSGERRGAAKQIDESAAASSSTRVFHGSRRACRERALLLETLGIAFELRQSGEHLEIHVPPSLHARAAAELAAYDVENTEPRDRPTPRHDLSLPVSRSHGWLGIAMYGVAIIAVAVLRDRHAFGFDWFNQGKTSASLIREGHLWRCVTALTLHADTYHLAGNLAAGCLFGYFAGGMLGAGVAWLAILLSGSMGNLINALLRDDAHTSVGASTAVFGALGLLGALAWTQRRGIRYGHMRRWTPVIGSLILLGFLGTGGIRTDVLAHMTGFTSGLAIGTLAGHAGDDLPERRGKQWLAGAAAIGLVVLSWELALTYG